MQRDMRVTRVHAGTLAKETDRLAVDYSAARASSCFQDRLSARVWGLKSTCSSTMIVQLSQGCGIRAPERRYCSLVQSRNLITIDCNGFPISLSHSINSPRHALSEPCSIFSRVLRPSCMKSDFIRPLRACNSPTASAYRYERLLSNTCYFRTQPRLQLSTYQGRFYDAAK